MDFKEKIENLPITKLSSKHFIDLNIQRQSSNVESNSEHNTTISLEHQSFTTTPHICSSCEKPILDEFLSSVLNQWWHESCLKCAECGRQLSETCYSREGKSFCKDDFYRRFAPRCSGCVETFRPTDLVRKARGHYFHVNCFICHVCRRELNTGDQLLICGNNAFICKQDYLAGNHGSISVDYVDEDDEDDEEDDEDDDDGIMSDYSSVGNSIKLEPGSVKDTIKNNKTNEESALIGYSTNLSLQNIGMNDDINTDKMENNSRISVHDLENNDGSEVLDESDRKHQDKSLLDKDDPTGTKRRGPRTTIKAKQLEVMKTAFINTPKPTRHIREQLAKETGLPMRVIQVWFQNKRSKERRMKQMCGRGKFFMAPGLSPNGKLRKFDDSRLFFYEGGPYGPPYGPPFSSTDFGFTSANRPPFSSSGSISSMEQHLPMRMSMLGNGPPLRDSSLSLPLLIDEYSSTTAATATGASDIFIPPSQLLSTGSHAGAEDEIKKHLPHLQGKHRSDLELQLSDDVDGKAENW